MTLTLIIKIKKNKAVWRDLPLTANFNIFRAYKNLKRFATGKQSGAGSPLCCRVARWTHQDNHWVMVDSQQNASCMLIATYMPPWWRLIKSRTEGANSGKPPRENAGFQNNADVLLWLRKQNVIVKESSGKITGCLRLSNFWSQMTWVTISFTDPTTPTANFLLRDAGRSGIEILSF